MNNVIFDPATTKLLKGINLIEASAGTGKTYCIAMLVLRFVVERSIPIQSVLLVTFTKAATEELKDRVRSKLSEARRAVVGTTEAIDDSIRLWLNKLDIDSKVIKQRLDMALLDIDQAGIFTIHGFCQRVLSEHALESGQLFDAEMLDDLADIKQACADDFWRRQIYPRQLWEAALLTRDYKTPDDLLASINFIGTDAMVYPPAQSLDLALANIQQCVELAKQTIDDCVLSLKNHLKDEKFKASYSDNFDAFLIALKEWLESTSITVPDDASFNLLTENGLFAGLNGNKFRANKTHSAEQRKAEYLADLSIDTAPFDALYSAVKLISLQLRRALLETLHQDLDKQLQQLNKLSFDSLITRLADVLRSSEGDHLIEELQQRFAVALIDEFQDTDNHQWTIFSQVFAAASHYLYLIGDPKQAIYKFRGADIYAYLSAQQQAQHRYTLGKNWRSHPQLVDAVNTLFQREQAFFQKDLLFHKVSPALSADAGGLYQEGKTIAPLVLWQLEESDSKSGYWRADSLEAARGIAIAVANEIVDLLNTDFSFQPGNRKLQPRDIAILVRTNSQARVYQEILRTAGVPSVLNSTESVFASREAADLYNVLRAIEQPGDGRLLKQALVSDWFGLDGQALYQLNNDENALDAWMSRFLGYFQDWQQQGLMAMLQRLMSQEKIEINLSKSVLAERRLTNIHHIVELIQQAAMDNHLGINKTLDWLRSTITKAVNKERAESENQQLRLESDDDAVQIVTLHRSKGLEYNIVFCPTLWQRSQRLQSEKNRVLCHENNLRVADLGSENFERRKNQALDEELAEELRIMYVALTRAKYRCYLAWVNARSEQSPNNSAMAWLLEFAEADFSSQQALLQGFKDKAGQCFDYRLLAISDQINGVYQKPNQNALLQAGKRRRNLYSHWQMSSYTALSSLSLQDSPELPEDKANEIQTNEMDVTETQLPKGAHTGNVIHDLLENIPYTALAKIQDISELRDKACQRYGLTLQQPDIIDNLLHTIVVTPLSKADSGFRLMNIPDRQCLKEMPFYMSMSSMNASQINHILKDIPSFQPLSSKAMSGYLTGFIDLVCEYDGRYYVMDYKTNSLPNYHEESLVQAMREHNYGLQFWVYSLVLHLYLQKRLPEYHFDHHFGGVLYLFVRGMQPDIPMSGVYQSRPDLARIQALAEVFGIQS